MKFRFVWVGKTKNKNWLALQEDYLQRLSHFIKFEVIELKDSEKESEGKKIIEVINSGSLMVLMAVEGKKLNSFELAEKVENWQNQSIKEITFVIGGAEGVSFEVVKKANFELSLSPLTLTHETARVVLVEQLYRAFTIIKGFPYQK